jgi:hypothetical protein
LADERVKKGQAFAAGCSDAVSLLPATDLERTNTRINRRFATAAAAIRRTATKSVVTVNQEARSPVDVVSQCPLAEHEDVPAASDGFAPGTCASRP